MAKHDREQSSQISRTAPMPLLCPPSCQTRIHFCHIPSNCLRCTISCTIQSAFNWLVKQLRWTGTLSVAIARSPKELFRLHQMKIWPSLNSWTWTNHYDHWYKRFRYSNDIHGTTDYLWYSCLPEPSWGLCSCWPLVLLCRQSSLCHSAKPITLSRLSIPQIHFQCRHQPENRLQRKSISIRLQFIDRDSIYRHATLPTFSLRASLLRKSSLTTITTCHIICRALTSLQLSPQLLPTTSTICSVCWNFFVYH